MADIKNFGIVGVGGTVQYGKGGGSWKWDTDGFVSTSDGTTLADLDAATMNFTGLSGTGAVTVTNILDEDNMASDSATALATQQSIKAYVDSQVGATTLSGTGDSGAFSVDLDSETFGVFGGTNLTSTGSGSNVTVALDADISLTSVTATGTIEGGSLTDGTATITSGSLTGGVNGTFSGTLQAASLVGTADLTLAGFLVDGIIDDDTMATASATTLATSESVKAYVDSVATAADLDIAGDSGTGSVDLDSQVFTIAGGIGLSSSTSGQTTTVRLDNTAVTAGTYGDATNIPQFTVDQQGRITSAANVAIQTSWTLTGDSGSETVNGGDTVLVAGGTNITTAVSATDTVTIDLDDDITLAGNVNAVNGTFSGEVTFGSGSGGTLSGLKTITAESVVATSNIVLGGYTVTDIIDDDTFATANATNLPTAESVKAYVDATATAADLDFQGDSGTGAVDLDSQTFDIAGGLNLTTTASGQTLTVAMDTTLTGMTAATFSGTVQAGTLTDGTASISSGAITGATDITATGTITGGTLTDGTASITSGAITGATNITASGTVQFGSLSDGTITVDAFESTLSGAAGNVATSEAVKNYVDAAVSASDLDFAGDSGSGSVDLERQTFTIACGTGLTSAGVGQTLTMNIDNTGVTAGDYGSATQIPAFTVNAQGQITSASNVAIQTSWTLTGDSGSETVNGGDTVLIAGGDNITTAVTATDTATVNLDTTLSNMVGATFSGTVQAGTLTDGTASISGGAITGATDITATGTITGNALTDGVATLSGGSLTGGVEGIFSKTVTVGNLDASGGLVTFNQLSDGTLTMDAILDEDNMASDSATALPTQQSVKAYVDSQITLQGAAMNIQGDTGTGSIVFATETLDIAGTANEIETNFDNGTNTMTIGLPDDVTIGNLTVSGTLTSDDLTASSITIDGDMAVTGDTVMQGNLTVNGTATIINSNTIASGDAIIVLNADLPSGQAPSQDMGLEMNRGSSANVEMLWLETVDYFVFRDENDVLQEVRAGTFNGTTLTDGTLSITGGDLSTTGDVTFGTLTDGGESIAITKFVDEADGIANNDNDTTIPTSAAVIDYVTNNGGDGNLIRNGSVGTGATTVTIGTVPNVAGRTYYVEKVVIKVTVGFTGNSVDHIIVNENGGLGTQIVTEPDADIVTGTYVIESDGATTLTSGQTILLGFRDSSNNLVAPTAGAASVAVYYAWD